MAKVSCVFTNHSNLFKFRYAVYLISISAFLEYLEMGTSFVSLDK